MRRFDQGFKFEILYLIGNKFFLKKTVYIVFFFFFGLEYGFGQIRVDPNPTWNLKNPKCKTRTQHEIPTNLPKSLRFKLGRAGFGIGRVPCSVLVSLGNHFFEVCRQWGRGGSIWITNINHYENYQESFL